MCIKDDRISKIASENDQANYFNRHRIIVITLIVNNHKGDEAVISAFRIHQIIGIDFYGKVRVQKHFF